MIFDCMENLKQYEKSVPNLDKAIAYLEDHDLSTMEVGTYEVDGKNVFLRVQEYVTKNPEDMRVEAHDDYLDFQIMVDGVEYVGYLPRKMCGEQVEKNVEADMVFFNDIPMENLSLRAGMFAILFPQDGHKPCVKVEDNIKVRKCVFKLHI